MGVFDRSDVASRRPTRLIRGRLIRGRLIRRFGVAAALIALVASAFAAGGFAATTTKPFKVDVSPHSVAAGSSTDFTATITNEASPQQLGSANVTAPTGFTVTGASILSKPAGTSPTATQVGNVVQLRNLALPAGPQGVVTVTITATAPCTAPVGGSPWAVTAKQSNDYNGPPGNDFVLDTAASNLTIGVTGAGGCHLNFFTEPADAAINTTITSTPFNTPTGTSVQVEVLDGSNHRVTSSTAPISVAINSQQPGGTGTLSGGGSQNAVAGVASFSSLKIDTHGIYTLIATSPGITSDVSGPLTIWDSAQACAADKSCSTTLGDVNTYQTQFSGTSTTSGFLLLTLGQDPKSSLPCSSSFNYAPSVTTGATYLFTANGNKKIVSLIDKTVDQLQPNNGVSFYRVCFESDDITFTYPGNVVHPMGTAFILPDCKSVANTPPCVNSITKTNAGDVIETITLPPNDGFRYR
jgi:hypothetical protein